MKVKNNLLIKHLIYLVLFAISVNSAISQKQDNYDLNLGIGKGLRFWNGSDSFKIHMGHTDFYKYGPVTDLSIKTNMTGASSRGWTWGSLDKEPIAGLNLRGNFQIAGDFVAKGNATVGDGGWATLIIDGSGDNNWMLNSHSNGESFFIRSNPEGKTNFSNILMSMNRRTSNIGIGTLDPTAKLHVNGDVVFNTEDQEYTSIRLGRKNNTRIFADNGSSKIFGGGMFFRVHDEATPIKYRDAMVIADNGNIGVNSLRPQARLHVNGDVIFNTEDQEYTSIRLGRKNNTRIFADNGSSKIFGGGMFFRVHDEATPTKYRDAMVIADNGNIGINTLSPKNKLSVEGTIWAKEIKVSLTDGADWVFEDDYKLRTLTEVEAYINKNKHLPEIPSAEEFRENDMKVSEMTNKLLQKIEELTLYTIQQEKELQKMKILEARLATLEAALAK